MSRRKLLIFEHRQIICTNNCKLYASIGEASRDLKISKNLIYRVLNGNQDTTHGYKFYYIDDPNIEIKAYYKVK